MSLFGDYMSSEYKKLENPAIIKPVIIKIIFQLLWIRNTLL